MTNYFDLPLHLSAEALRSLTLERLSARPDGPDTRKQFFEELCQIAQLYASSYRYPEQDLKEKITAAVAQYIDWDSPEIIDCAASIIVLLDLEAACNLVLERESEIQNNEVLEIIRDLKDELIRTADDPSAGFWRNSEKEK